MPKIDVNLMDFDVLDCHISSSSSFLFDSFPDFYPQNENPSIIWDTQTWLKLGNLIFAALIRRNAETHDLIV